MTSSYRLLLAFILVCLFKIGKANVPVDTTKKAPVIRTTGSTFNLSNIADNVNEGLVKLREGDTETGLKLLENGLERAVNEKHVDRVLPFQGLQTFEFIRKITTPNALAPEDKQLGLLFFKAGATKDPGILGNNPDAYLKKLKPTEFNLKLRLFIDALENNKSLGTEIKDFLKKWPSDINVNVLQAEQLYYNEHYKDCLEACNKVIELDSVYAVGYEMRAGCYKELNQPQKAINDYDTAIRLFPQYFTVWYEKADVLLDLDKNREAIDAYWQMYKVNPQYKWCYYNMARGYKNLSMLDSALYFINLHIDHHTDDGDGFDVKGDIFYARNDYPAAIAQYSEAIVLDPKKERFYEDRGDAYFSNNENEKALADFNKAAELDTKKPYPLERIGDYFYMRKEYEKAVPYYQKSVKTDPGYKYGWESLNLCYTNMGKYKDAIVSAKRALAIDSTYDSALGNLGWTYYCDGNYDDCIKYSYLALNYNKKATYAMFNIALATLRKGDFEKAKELYSGFISNCKANNYEINEGAKTDLKDLIDKHVYEKEAKYIIENIFK